MTTQLFWIIFGVFVLGLFVGSNLGVMLMCVLHAAGRDHALDEEVVPVTVQVQG
jgi:hypothetical protein